MELPALISPSKMTTTSEIHSHTLSLHPDIHRVCCFIELMLTLTAESEQWERQNTEKELLSWSFYKPENRAVI